MRWEEIMLKTVSRESKDSIELNEIEIGRVISVEPLQIMIKDLPLFRNNLYINPDLLEHTKEIVSNDNDTIRFKTSLKADDLVAVCGTSLNKYIVLCKLI